MGNENSGRKVSKTVGHRKKLLDITNTPTLTPLLLKSRIHDEYAQELAKGSLAQLQEELASVKKMLEEKEEIIAESKRCMEKLWFNYCRKSKQNDEIILHNSQLYRDLTQARDQLKVLQHENIQMSALYKVCKSEMQEKLKEALDQVDRLTKLVEASSLKQASDKHCLASMAPSRFPCDTTGGDSVNIHGKSELRKRERKSYKEPSLKMKLRQMNGGSLCPSDAIQCDSNLVPSGPIEFKGSEASTPAAVLASCLSSVMRRAGANGCQMEISQQCTEEGPVVPKAGENGSQMKASQGCTEKGLAVPKCNTRSISTHESKERPRRRAASSVGSYKEPSLITKMRRVSER